MSPLARPRPSPTGIEGEDAQRGDRDDDSQREWRVGARALRLVRAGSEGGTQMDLLLVVAQGGGESPPSIDTRPSLPALPSLGDTASFSQHKEGRALYL